MTPHKSSFGGAQKLSSDFETANVDVQTLNDRNALATFGPAAGEDFTSVLGRHAVTEPVGTGTFQSAWLECAFHGLRPFESLERAG